MSIDCWQIWTPEMSSGNGPIAYKITFRHPIFCLIIRNVSCKQTRGNPCILSQSTIALALERGNWAIAKYDPHFACYEGRKTYEIANLALKVQFGRKKCCWNTVSESMLLKLQNGLFYSKGLNLTTHVAIHEDRYLQDIKMLLAARIWQTGILISTSIESILR